MKEKLYSINEVAIIIGFCRQTVAKIFNDMNALKIGKRKYLNQQQFDKLIGK